MCTSYWIMRQREGKGNRWVTTETLEFPGPNAPTCGCWLWLTKDYWTRAAEAHTASGNWEKFPNTRHEANQLEDQFREIMASLNIGERFVIERLV